MNDRVEEQRQLLIGHDLSCCRTLVAKQSNQCHPAVGFEVGIPKRQTTPATRDDLDDLDL